MSQNWVVKGLVSADQGQALMALIDTEAEWVEGPPILSLFKTNTPDKDLAEIFFPQQPDNAYVEALIHRAGLDTHDFITEAIAEKDWVAESQKLLAPVHAGRFIIHGSHDRDKHSADAIALEIEAGQAFGTGQHETTKACLTFIDQMEINIPDRILDVGTGSGVLAMACAALWPGCPIIGTDIDPIAVSVAIENAALNGLPKAAKPGEPGLSYFAATGVDHSLIVDNGPFDLILANILAAPLIALAPSIAAVARDGATLILAGLLATQADDVLAAYSAQGFILVERIDDGEWSSLKLSA